MDCTSDLEDNGTVLGKPAEEGESPVHEIQYRSGSIRSTTRHEKPCGKAGGPPPKAKYYSVTESEAVLGRKGEKDPGQGSERAPETLCLRTVEDLFFGRSTAYFL